MLKPQNEDDIVKGFMTRLSVPRVDMTVLEADFDQPLANALQSDNRVLYCQLIKLGHEKIYKRDATELSSALKHHLLKAQEANKLNIFLGILDEIRKYTSPNGPIDPMHRVNVPYLKAFLDQKVKAYQSDKKSDRSTEKSNEFDWVVGILIALPDIFITAAIFQQISTTKPELAYRLYLHPDVKSHLKSKDQESVLLMACRLDDLAMVNYCSGLEAERKKIKQLVSSNAVVELDESQFGRLLERAFASDDGRSYFNLFYLRQEIYRGRVVELPHKLKYALESARTENKLKVYMGILGLIKSYTANGAIEAKDGVDVSSLRTVLDLNVAAYRSDKGAVKSFTAVGEFDWVVEY